MKGSIILLIRYMPIFLPGILFTPSRALACMGPELEVAQERDAQVVIEGRLMALRTDQGKPFSTLTFQTLKTIRGDHRAQWTVSMRGERRPKSLEEYVKTFGRSNELGIRLAQGIDSTRDATGAYIVDNACNMNNDDWFIRPLNSYQALEVRVGHVTSTAATKYHNDIERKAAESASGIRACATSAKTTPGKHAVQVELRTRGPGQYVSSQVKKSAVTDPSFQKCVAQNMARFQMPWTSQNLEDIVKTEITYVVDVCQTNSTRKCR